MANPEVLKKGAGVIFFWQSEGAIGCYLRSATGLCIIQLNSNFFEPNRNWFEKLRG